MKRPIAYSYLRFSTPEQMRGDSFRRQSEMAIDYAARHGLKLDDTLTFQDLGVSAFHGKNAETGHLAEFLSAVTTGAVAKGSYLLVESLDRISRQTARKAIRLLGDIADAGITLVTLADGRAYTAESLDNDPMALMMALLIFIRANEESVAKSRRIRAAWEAKRANASSKPLTARCPAWLRLRSDRSGFEVIEERAAVVRSIYEMALAGKGQHAIADALNKQGVQTWGDNGRAPAKHWHRSYVIKVLSSSAVIGSYTPRVSERQDGKRVFKPLDPVPNYYPAIVSTEVFQRVAILRQSANAPRRGRNAATPTRHLLAGLAKCPLCGGTMTRVSKGSSKRAGRPYLVCQRAKSGAGCEYHTVPVEWVDNALTVFGDVIANSSPASDNFKALDAEHADAVAQIEKLDADVDQLVDTIVQRPSAALSKRLARLEAEREALIVKRRALREAIDNSHTEFVSRRIGGLQDGLLDVRAAPTPEKIAAANTRLRENMNAVVVDYRKGALLFDWKHGAGTELAYARTINGKAGSILAPLTNETDDDD